MKRNYSQKYEHNCSCKFCGSSGSTRYQGFCQACYRYFILEGKKLYAIPNPGEIAYTPDGDVVCPECGKAFRKLGNHLWQAHGMKCDEAFKKFGWHRRKTKATNAEYRSYMHDIQDPKTIDDNLLVKGDSTRFGKSTGNPLALNTRAVKARCSNCCYLTSKDGTSWDCDAYEKPCKFVIHCVPLDGEEDN